MTLKVFTDRLALREVFTISRGSRTHAEVLRVTITRDGLTGQGECVPYARYGETLDSVRAQITALPEGIDRAVDCALWDLQAKQTGTPVWALAGEPEPTPVTTAFTLSLAPSAEMREQAARHANRPILKVKLGGGAEDEARIRAVREGAPGAEIIVDANEGWTAPEYQRLAPVFVDLGVTLVEQPLPAAEDSPLADLTRPLPVCADESCHDSATLAGLAGKYDVVNIKLDKTGGLTEALALRTAARAAGFRVMVGCMVGSSLAMAPALLVAQGAEVVDLDGPLLLAEDRDPPLAVDGSRIFPADPELWG